MSTFLCVVGWVTALVALAAWTGARRRLERVAAADHELRGPAAALGLAVASIRREPLGVRHAQTLEPQLDRLRAGLDDLAAARGTAAPRRRMPIAFDGYTRRTALAWRPAALAAGRRLTVRWEGRPAVVVADRGRIAQALGNLLSNAVDHGTGPIEVRGRRWAGGVRIEVSDRGPAADDAVPRPDRGRGLGIAARAAREAGGNLTIERRPEGTVAALELPLAER